MKKISILIIILLLVSNIFFIKNKTSKIVPFKNSHNEDIRIPIIQKDINNEKVLFILDSGANISIIDSTWYYDNKHMFTEAENINMVLTGISGVVSINSKIIYTEIDEDYVVFTITDLIPVTQNLSKQGFKIVGILGSDYLKDNNLIIDYKKQAVYTAS